MPDPESGLELRWQNGDGTIDEARAEAQSLCGAAAKRAVLAAEFMDQDETLARFYCVASPAAAVNG